MKNSQKSNTENIRPWHEKQIVYEDSPRMQQILKVLFTLTDSHHFEKGVLSVLEGLLLFVKNDLTKNDFAYLDITPGDVAQALAFAEGRKYGKDRRKKQGEKFEGRPSTVKEVKDWLTTYPVFSADFIHVCRLVEDRYPYSTVMKALKQLCPP